MELTKNTQQKIQAKKSSYRPEIDGLRALAVIAVIINHLNPALIPSGFLGVDIFFVISGFVVTSSLSNKADQSWQDYLLSFYSRRVKRLIPALVTCVIITSLIGCLFIDDPRASLRTGMASLFGFSNLYLLKESTDYFGQIAELNLFTQTWSLGVEEQFYLMFPVLLGLCGFSRQRHHKGNRNLLISVLILSVISFIGYLSLAQTNVSAAFFLMPARFWELGAGCLTFLVVRGCKQSFLNRFKAQITLISLCLVVGVLFISKDLQTTSTVAIAILTCIVIWSFDQPSIFVELFSFKWITKIGLLSYSLYLWHWSVIVISRWTIGISKWTIPLQLILMIGLALASYKWIETPLRHATWSKAQLKTIGYGVSTTFTAALLLIGLNRPLGGKLYTGQRYPDDRVSFKLDRNYKPCNNAISASKDFSECSYPPFSSSAKTIYFVGDSHTRSLKALASRLVKEEDIPRIVMLIKKGCFFSTSLARQSQNGQLGTGCLDSNRAFLSKVIEHGKEGDIVVISVRYKAYFIMPNNFDDIDKWKRGEFSLVLNDNLLSSEQALKQYSQELVKLSQELSQKKISLVVQSSLPDWKHKPSECQTQWFSPSFLHPETCSLDFKSESSFVAPVINSFLKAGIESNNLYVYDPFPLFCNAKRCKPFDDNGTPLFKDSNHLNNYGAEYMYQDFVQFLEDHSLI